MIKIILKVTTIILVNLFAFLLVGNILDTIFETGSKFTIMMLIVSIFPLIVFLFVFVGKSTGEFASIKTKKNPKTKGGNNTTGIIDSDSNCDSSGCDSSGCDGGGGD